MLTHAKIRSYKYINQSIISS